MYVILSKLTNCKTIRAPLNAGFALLACKGIGVAFYEQNMAYLRSNVHLEDLLPFKQFETPQEEVEHTIWKISSTIIMTFGTIGNTLAIVVLSKKKMRRKPSSLFLIGLAVSYLLMLYLGLLHHCIRIFNEVDIRDLTLQDAGHIFFLFISLPFS